jgi:hypothetical protein
MLMPGVVTATSMPQGKLAAGMQITRDDLAPFRAKMEPAYKRIAAYSGEENVKKFRTMVETARTG